MIVTEGVSLPPSIAGVDRLFFSSPRSIEHFYALYGQSAMHLPVGVMGEGSARVLPAGVRCMFTGSGTTEAAAQSFVQKFSTGCTGLVCGSASRPTIRAVFDDALPSGGWRPLLVYTTREAGAVVEPCDVYVFTSPSNVRGFLASNAHPPAGRCIAIGLPTAEAWGHGALVSEGYAPEDLWNAILSALLS